MKSESDKRDRIRSPTERLIKECIAAAKLGYMKITITPPRVRMFRTVLPVSPTILKMIVEALQTRNIEVKYS
jgi:hypothetical protein